MVPTGGGGLIAGIAAAVHFLAPQVRVVGVQAEKAAAWPGSLAEGAPVEAEALSTMADGIAIGLPGAVPFAHVNALVDEVVTVSEDALSRALLLCSERAKLIVEPAGGGSGGRPDDLRGGTAAVWRGPCARCCPAANRPAAAHPRDHPRPAGRRALPGRAGHHPGPARRAGAGCWAW